MCVQHAADVFVCDEFGEFAVQGECDLFAGFAQFRCDERQAERRVNLFFCCARENFLPIAQSVSIQGPAFLLSQPPQRRNVLFRTRGQQKRGAVAGLGGDVNGQSIGGGYRAVF